MFRQILDNEVLKTWKAFLLVWVLLISKLEAAQVVKVGKSGELIAVRDNSKTNWTVGSRVCVKPKNRSEACGEIIKIPKQGLIIKLETPLSGLAKGDTIALSGGVRTEGTRPSLGIGVGGGVNLAKVSSQDASSSSISTRTAADFGVWVQLPVGYGLAIEPGFYFAQKGYETNSSALGLSYLDLRILLSIKILKSSVRPAFYFGPYAGYLLTADSSTFLGAESVKDSLKSLDFGLMGGLGLEVDIQSILGLRFSGLYSLGLTSIDNTSDGNANSSTHNRVFHFLTSLIFHL